MKGQQRNKEVMWKPLQTTPWLSSSKWRCMLTTRSSWLGCSLKKENRLLSCEGLSTELQRLLSSQQICEDLLKNIKEACEYQKHILTECDVAEALEALIAFTKHENQEEIRTSLGETFTEPYSATGAGVVASRGGIVHDACDQSHAQTSLMKQLFFLVESEMRLALEKHGLHALYLTWLSFSGYALVPWLSGPPNTSNAQHLEDIGL